MANGDGDDETDLVEPSTYLPTYLPIGDSCIHPVQVIQLPSWNAIDDTFIAPLLFWYECGERHITIHTYIHTYIHLLISTMGGGQLYHQLTYLPTYLPPAKPSPHHPGP